MWTAENRPRSRLGRLLHLSPTKHAISSLHRPLTARLPPELIDHIIDYFHDDKDTLLKLSLVCHALLPSVRYHLFDRLTITNSNVKTISNLLRKDKLDFALYVRKLVLQASDGRSNEVSEELRAILSGDALRPLLRTFFLIIAPHFRNVTSLLLKAVPLEESIVGMLAPCFPQLNSLSLSDCILRCNADLDKLMRDHPAIHTLQVGRLCSLHGLDHTESIGPRLHLPVLRVIEMFAPNPLTVVPWLSAHCTPHHFMYTVSRLEHYTQINAALGEMESLTHLHLVLHRLQHAEIYEVEESPSLVGLVPRYLPMITTMTLDAKKYMLPLVVTMLAQLDPPSFARLRTINLKVYLDESDIVPVDAGLCTWADMEEKLLMLLLLQSVNIYNKSWDHSTHAVEEAEAAKSRLLIEEVESHQLIEHWMPAVELPLPILSLRRAQDPSYSAAAESRLSSIEQYVASRLRVLSRRGALRFLHEAPL